MPLKKKIKMRRSALQNFYITSIQFKNVNMLSNQAKLMTQSAFISSEQSIDNTSVSALNE